MSDNRAAAFEPLPAIFPGHMAPVVRRAADGERELSLLSWGFVLPQKGRVARRVTNARDDKVRTSGFWRGSFEERRCLVPVTSFAEPQGKRPAVWHWFALDETPGPCSPLPASGAPSGAISDPTVTLSKWMSTPS